MKSQVRQKVERKIVYIDYGIPLREMPDSLSERRGEDVRIVIEAETKEIAALILEVSERRGEETLRKLIKSLEKGRLSYAHTPEELSRQC